MDDGLLTGLTPTALTDAVRASAGVPSAEVVTWAIRSIYEPRVAATLGVYAVEGTARAGGGPLPFRLVLKVLADDRALAAAELAAYHAFAVRPPHGLDAPRLLGTVALGPDATGLWLESVEDETSAVWSPDVYARAAFHCGQYAGTDLAEGAPGLALSGQPFAFRAQQDVRGRALRLLREQSDHPVLSRAYPPDVVAGLERLWAARERLLDALDGVPVAAFHGDFQRRNLVGRRSAREWRTVALDWANRGRAHLGVDPAVLLHQALVYFHADADPHDLDRAVFDGYLDGLRDAGVDVATDTVRLGYVLHAALWCGLMEAAIIGRQAFDPDWPARSERFNARPFADVLQRRVALSRFLVELVDRTGLL